MAGTQVARPTSLTKAVKRYQERLGTKLAAKAKSGVDKLSYHVRVFETRTIEVVGHIISVDAERVQVHNVRKSGSSKMDVSFFSMADVVSIEGKPNELGRVTLRKKTMIEEYKGVQVTPKGKLYQLIDHNKDSVIINSAVDGVEVEIVADADALATATKRSPAKKTPAKKTATRKTATKRRRRDEDDEF